MNFGRLPRHLTVGRKSGTRCERRQLLQKRSIFSWLKQSSMVQIFSSQTVTSQNAMTSSGRTTKSQFTALVIQWISSRKTTIRNRRQSSQNLLMEVSVEYIYGKYETETRKVGNFLAAPWAITRFLTFHFPCLVLGSEVQLKLRLSSNLSDVKLSVYSKDSIFACKKKLQVSFHVQAGASTSKSPNRPVNQLWIVKSISECSTHATKKQWTQKDSGTKNNLPFQIPIGKIHFQNPTHRFFHY